MAAAFTAAFWLFIKSIWFRRADACMSVFGSCCCCCCCCGGRLDGPERPDGFFFSAGVGCCGSARRGVQCPLSRGRQSARGRAHLGNQTRLGGNSSSQVYSTLRSYKHYKVRNQPPPPTPCSTDNFEESDSQMAYHNLLSFVHTVPLGKKDWTSFFWHSSHLP